MRKEQKLCSIWLRYNTIVQVHMMRWRTNCVALNWGSLFWITFELMNSGSNEFWCYIRIHIKLGRVIARLQYITALMGFIGRFQVLSNIYANSWMAQPWMTLLMSLLRRCENILYWEDDSLFVLLYALLQFRVFCLWKNLLNVGCDHIWLLTINNR